MKRIYESLLVEHLGRHRQMALLSGPRQVGKTTTSRASAPGHRYFNWDRKADRALIVKGPDAVADDLDLAAVRPDRLPVVFDEIHKYRKWKSFLKGFFDVFEDKLKIVVTGSARLTVYKRGGDSLMGRYFPYRMHPLTVAELASTDLLETEIRAPSKIDATAFEQLFEFGGFPEPFLKGSRQFYNRWKRLRLELLFREDLRDLTRIQGLGQIQVLADLLTEQAGQPVKYSTLAANTGVTIETVKRWLSTLESLYFCFSIRPWFRSVPKSLRKQPKVFLWDWSLIADEGARRENMVASHLLKAVHWWTDIGLGSYDLHFLRDKNKREVDFLVTRDKKPWFMVEVKSSGKRGVSPTLRYFQGQIKAPHAFQAAFDLEDVDEDLFTFKDPVRVPVTTLLSQLV
jgi:predicted AAA+ superfamily ATPase